MAGVVVIHTDSRDEEHSDELPNGDTWFVTDGVLNVVDLHGNPVASYPAGRWLNVLMK